MTRTRYYEELKELARAKRALYGLTTPRVLKTDFRRIFKEEGIQLDYWDGPLKKVRGAYFNDEHGKTIMIGKRLPNEPCVFTMAHEYKHHLTDQDKAVPLGCMEPTPESDAIEIGAEIFAAEFIFPEALFKQHMEERSISPGRCTAENLVRLKHETKTTLSYAALRKLAIWLNFAPATLQASGWHAIEDRLGLGYRRFVRAKTFSVRSR